jgi:hypothetical protein
MKITTKTKHYIEEVLVFVTLILAIIMADSVHKMIKGTQVINWVDIIVNIPSLIVIIFIGITVYGSMYSRPFKEEIMVAPLTKRIANAISHGFMWRLLLQ